MEATKVWDEQRQAQLIRSGIKENTKFTIDSLEVARMLEVEHYEVLRKLEGTTRVDGSVKQVGIIPILTDEKILVSDYFIKDSYIDSSGKENKCYLFTRLGCDFIANKFNGKKGILFTAKYVKRFNEMEQQVKKVNTKAYQQLINNFKAEVTTLVDEMVSEKINQIEEKCSEFFRPSSLEKRNISHYIMKRLGIERANEEYDLVKERVLIKLGATKWEDIPIETLKSSLNVVDESIRVIKADRVNNQLSIFD